MSRQRIRRLAEVMLARGAKPRRGSTLAIAITLLACLLQPPRLAAEDLRDFCPDRPGLNTPTCIVDRGHVVVESSFVDWTRQDDDATRDDTVLFGSTLIRYGLTDTLEFHASWDGYGLLRSRDRQAGTSQRDDGAGDIGFALRQNLRNPDGSGFSVAVMPYVTLPTGDDALSAGDWGAGFLVPISTELAKGISLALTPEIDAAVDADGNGRHVAWGSAVGLGFTLTDKLSLTVETQLIRDDDPDGAATTALAGAALAWKARDDLQFDVGLVRGLNTDSADWEIYSGIARRF